MESQSPSPIGNQPPKLPDYDYWMVERAQKHVACLRNPRVREAEYYLCSKDVTYWLTWFGVINEPRNEPEKQDLPFIPWDFQIIELKFLHEVFTRCTGAQGKKENVIYEKARDMGATWVVLMYFMWDWMFHGCSYLIGSRKEEEVDRPGDMDTPFQKIRYQLRFQPEWLKPQGFDPKKHSRHMLLINPNGGELVGESSNPNFGRGGRKKGVLYDELATWPYDSESWRSSAQSTNVRIGIFTPNGPHNKAARLRHGQEQEEVIVRSLYWWKHPLKAQGLEWINGKPTSPWYREQQRTLSPDDLAKEVDISYLYSQKGVVFENYGYAHQDPLLKPVEGRRIIRIWDPGIDFHVLFAQWDSYARALCLKELHWTDAKIDDIAEEVLDISAFWFNGYEFEDYGDPYGSYRHVSMQQDPEYIYLMEHYGIMVESAFMARIPPRDRIKHRITALRQKMSEFVGITNGPALIVNTDQCPMLDRAFRGEYRRKIDMNGNVLEQIDEHHPSEDAVDCAGMLCLAKGSFGRGTYAPLNIRQNDIQWRRPTRRTNNPRGWF